MNSLDTEFVTHRQWNGYASRIQNANLKKHGTSLTATGIARRASTFILDIQNDRNGMVVKKGWREAMKREE